MPTPFYHLNVAEDVLDKVGPDSALLANRPAFLFGNTAPDVQSISGQDRVATHFFDLPFQPAALPAWEKFLLVHPQFRSPWQLPADQAAFLAGYLCHLQADWLWVKDIFAPVFGPRCNWQTFEDRLFLHNVLRAYLDEKILPQLHLGGILSQVSPAGWLPFVLDEDLRLWRDFLARQLLPGAVSETVSVFAARQGLSPQVYFNRIYSESRMEQEVFSRIPRLSLTYSRERLLEANLSLLRQYFGSPNMGAN